MKEPEIKGRLDRIGKTPLEHFQDIKELEVADGPEITVEDILPYKCKQVKKTLKALEILKEHIKFEEKGIETYTDDLKNLVTKFLIRLESKDTGATFHIHLDTEEEFDLLKEVLEE